MTWWRVVIPLGRESENEVIIVGSAKVDRTVGAGGGVQIFSVSSAISLCGLPVVSQNFFGNGCP